MWVGKFALQDDGTIQWVDLGATAVSDASTLNGAAYHEAAQALFVTTEAVAAADPYIGGFRYRSDGALRVYDATAAVPAGASTNQGIAMTSDGQLCYTLDTADRFSLNGVSLDEERRVNAIPLAFLLEFADLGAGQVDTAETIYDTTPTFTRATAATTVLSNGLIASVATGVARSYYDPTSLTYLGYLAEGARTNLVLDGVSPSTAAGLGWGTDALATLTVSAEPSIISGEFFSLLARAGGGSYVYQSVSMSSGVAYTSSWYVKAADSNDPNFRFELNQPTDFVTVAAASLNLNTGVLTVTVGAGEVTACQNGVYRVSITGTPGTTGVNGNVVAVLGGVPDDGTGHYLGGVQLEAAAFASSYIPTTTAAVTRNADVLTYPTTVWFSATAGTFYAEGTAPNSATASPGNQSLIQIDDGTLNERYLLYRASGLATGDFAVIDGGVAQALLSSSTWSANAQIKMAAAYAASDFAFSANGTAPSLDSGGTLPTVTQIQIGTGDGALVGPIRRVAYYSARLANATLQGLTG